MTAVVQQHTVSIHAPTRGATDGIRLQRLLVRSFNPRPYKRGDLSGWCFPGSRGVSIHAPTRGATVAASGLLNIQHVSIHAPTRGATLVGVQWFVVRVVSIHAPTRGATPGCVVLGPSMVFQSTPLQEGRPERSIHTTAYRCFNPRPYKRGDNTCLGLILFPISFNPRPYKRGDAEQLKP